ncbi:hypothetical protein M5D96_005551 [Drosophila gunungcola]|uniref:ZAD domain-containing protein n=1 Tax=Drosophila gunungcola TaxID=103775 RepID=A0A9P9YQY7_9MUSC|nr:hypothetical protein M5D96_005551 [Drosophila gunungcola]
MVNIFDTTHESGISIALMISRCTEYKVEKGDQFPKTICASCLQDAHNAFEIIETYERSHQFFSFFKDVREEECEDAGSNCSEEVQVFRFTCEPIQENDHLSVPIAQGLLLGIRIFECTCEFTQEIDLTSVPIAQRHSFSILVFKDT